MDKTTIFQRIQKVENEVALLNNTLFALKSTDIVKYGVNYTELSTNATLRAERIACQLRNLVLFTDFKGNSTYMIQAADALGIKISYEDRIFSATLPGLLPKRRLHTNMAFLRDPLHAALKEFLKGQEVEPYKECVICFCFVYDRSLPKRRVKDYDNLELKTILDVISTYVLFDDSGLYCDSHYTTELGETDQIIVTIMEKKRFPEWLMNREKHKITISENM